MFSWLYDVALTYPGWLFALPAPLIIYYLIPAYRTRKSAIRVPFFDLLLDSLGETPHEGATTLARATWQRITLVISWICIVVAMTKPTILGEPQTRELMGRDIMVVVDLSGSMSETDFISEDGQKINRLDAAKRVLKDFAIKRTGDRLGLILFGDAAYIQTPFTPDIPVWLELLNQASVAMAGQSTHLGDAIGLAIKVFDRESSSPETRLRRERVAIVLTDGNDTDSYVPPIDAAKVARAKGVRIHMIAMGDPQTVGEKAIDMDIITRVAKESGGQAFQALDQKDLNSAYDKINELEPKLFESTTYRAKTSIHHYFVMIILLLNLSAFSLVLIKRQRVNRAYKRRGC
ncbi:VWA domain-containing protein [Vibrio sp. HN007]|uniref:vWA domain-containing protein n=1 Tax=Vibrio iocasae TaxID=3098914 RepID=UPI0035D4DA49